MHAMKMLTDARGAGCYVAPTAVVGIRADAYSAGVTEILLGSGGVMSVRGAPMEIHDWLFRNVPMGSRTPAPSSSSE